jgi:hypothetical protein
MNSTPTPKQTAPHDIADAALKEAHQQIGRAAGQLVRNEPASDLQQDAADDPLDHEERAAVLLRQRPSRGLIGALLLTAFVCAAAFAWQSYGDAAMVIARWTPERVSASSLVLTKQQPPAQLSQATVGVTTADSALPQPAPRAETTPQDVPPKTAPVSPELAQWLQTSSAGGVQASCLIKVVIGFGETAARRSLFYSDIRLIAGIGRPTPLKCASHPETATRLRRSFNYSTIIQDQPITASHQVRNCATTPQKTRQVPRVRCSQN